MGVLRINVSMSDGDNVVWRVNRELKEKARRRLGLGEYEKIAEAAEQELYNQVRGSVRRLIAEDDAKRRLLAEDEAKNEKNLRPQTTRK